MQGWVITAGYLYFTGSMWDTEVQKGAIQRAISVCRQAGITLVFDLADLFAVDRYREGFGEGLVGSLRRHDAAPWPPCKPAPIMVHNHQEDHEMIQTFTALIQREDDMFVALCTDLDIASQGASIAEARENLKEAVELFLEEASEAEIAERIHTEQYISSIEVTVAEA
jgi:predicted RNase H-like HicB family nuclease